MYPNRINANNQIYQSSVCLPPTRTIVPSNKMTVAKTVYKWQKQWKFIVRKIAIKNYGTKRSILFWIKNKMCACQISLN